MRQLSGRMGSLTPERLVVILGGAEDGRLDEWADLCDRMVEVDAAVRSSYETRLAAVAGARCYIEPGTPTGDPKRDALIEEGRVFAERAIFGITGLEVSVQESLDGIGKGVAAHEIEWEVVNDEVLPIALHWVHARRFKWRREDWKLVLMDPGTGEYPVQGIELQPDGWIVHAPKTVAGYPTRVGALRAVAWPYLHRRWAMQFWMTGSESFAYPFLWATVPRGADKDVRSEALDGLETMTTERRGVADEGTTFNLLETTVKDGGVWREMFDTNGKEIAKALLGMTDLSDPGRVGAYAAVEVRRGTTVDARIAMDERALSTSWTQQLIEPLMRMNAGKWNGIVPPTPRIRWAIATAVKEIPPHLLPYFDDDEVRATAGAGARPKAAPRITAEDIGALDSMLKMLTSGKYAPEATRMLLSKAFPQFTSEELALVLPGESVEASPAAPEMPASSLPEPGSMWTDTEDGHRVKVNTVEDGFVRFVDLDSENPGRQWEYAIKTWRERFTPAPAEAVEPVAEVVE